METAVGLGAVLLAIIALARTLLTDGTIKKELALERAEHKQEREEWRGELNDMRERLAKVESENKQVRSEKHKQTTELARVTAMLGTMITLADACTCGIFDRIQNLTKHYAAELAHITTPKTKE